MHSFQELGCRLERRWLATNYNEEFFPQLAVEELSRESLHQHVTPSQVADWLFEPNPHFRQPNASELFGEPPVLLFQGPRFYIEALYWFSGTTSIHEHSFSGAFAVLAGSSLHSHWRFKGRPQAVGRFSHRGSAPIWRLGH